MLLIPYDSPLVQHLLTSWWTTWQLNCHVLFNVPVSRHWLDSLLCCRQTLYRHNYVGSAVIRFIFEMYKGNVGIESFRNLLAVGIELDILPIPF